MMSMMIQTNFPNDYVSSFKKSDCAAANDKTAAKGQTRLCKRWSQLTALQILLTGKNLLLWWRHRLVEAAAESLRQCVAGCRRWPAY
jgi:hypothetical protein